jgi:putative (di)nucleoside polyphosphate hydrolase
MKHVQAPTDARPLALPYRRAVGIMLINRRGLVWTGRRLPKWAGDRALHIWQMPQGGIDRGEAPEHAAYRELEEETSVTSADIVAEHPGWLTYELPHELLGVALKGRYCGQRQRWFAMRFWGDDSEIDIRPRNGSKAEFDRWSWRPIDELPQLIVPFKRPVYEAVVTAFSRFARPD